MCINHTDKTTLTGGTHLKNEKQANNSTTQTLMNPASLTSEPSFEQKRQLELEKNQREQLLATRQKKTHEAQAGGRASQTDGARGIRFLVVPMMAAWLDKHLEKVNSTGRAGFAVAEVNRISSWVDSETMCHITLSVILDKLGRGSTLRAKISSVQAEIGRQLEHQAQLAYMEAVDPEYFLKLQKWYLHDPVRRYDKKIKAMKHAHNRHEDMNWIAMTETEQIVLGSLLLKTAMSIIIDPETGEGFFQRVQPKWNDLNLKKRSKKESIPYYLGFSKAGLLYRDKLQKAADFDAMFPRPMVCEPMDWAPGQRGGYLSHVNSKFQEMIHGNSGSEPSQLVFDAINRLQRQSFKVNTYILKLQKELLRKTWEIGSFRSYEKDSWEDEHFPLVDSDYIATLDTDSEEYKAEMKKLSTAYHDQKIEEQKSEPPRRIWGIANEFKNEERIYFPWFLDSRGRLYPSVSGCSPQGPDYGKALLRSADGAPITEDTRRDLLISIATAGAFDGVDKEDFFTRLRWAEQYCQGERFEAMVQDPMVVQDWMEADEPFCFLALCEEYYRTHISHKENEGMAPDRVYVFFGRDQTCSGVQILSAIIQDEKAAYFTNIMVTEKPQDLYGEVAKEAKALMQDKLWLQQRMEEREAKRVKHNKKAKPDKQWEERWVVDVDPEVHDRSVNKTQAMTCGYGATLRTRYNNIKTALRKKIKKGQIEPIHVADQNIVCAAGIHGMEHAFPAYMDLNKWFKKLAKAALQAGCEQITWTTPSGMFVSQEYREPVFTQVSTYAAGGGHYAKLNLCSEGESYVETGYGDVKLSKNESAIAANFVHSLDGSVMALGILDTPVEVQLYSVHDCVYTLSGYFGSTIPHFRKAMHNVVTSPVLEELLESNGLTDMVELPPIGEIDLDQIKESPYLFC